MHQMLSRCNCGSSDVIKAWDRNRDGELAEPEFLKHMEGLFKGSDDLWKEVIAPLAKRVFVSMGQQGSESRVLGTKVNVIELEVSAFTVSHSKVFGYHTSKPAYRDTSPKDARESLPTPSDSLDAMSSVPCMSRLSLTFPHASLGIPAPLTPPQGH